MFVFLNLLAQKDFYPEIENIDNLKEGYIELKQGITKNKIYKEVQKKISTTYGTIVVKENREKANSELITLPFKVLHSFSDNPKEPIFFLFGGPGSSNVDKLPNAWLLKNHDVVLVGYRGVDGAISLDRPEIAETLIATDSDPFNASNMKKLSVTSLKVYNEFLESGIDMDAYNMIEVIKDMEDVRKALGYEKINMLSLSYGTRLAYLYGLEYPENVNRSILEGVNPPGCFVWKPEDIDNLYAYLGEEWKKNPECIAKSQDIIKTIEDVLAELPSKWKKININPDKVKFMMFMISATRNGIAQVFDAFVAASEGDYSGVAGLSMLFDHLPNFGVNFGDQFSKAVSADFELDRDYIKDMEPQGSIIGSPYSKIFAVNTYGGWPIALIPEDYRKLQKSNVETLLISGSIDISTPPHNATEMLEYLPNGHQVILENRGHEDPGFIQSQAYEDLIMNYFQSGEVDDSKFENIPIEFNNPKPSLQKMAKVIYTLDRLNLSRLLF